MIALQRGQDSGFLLELMVGTNGYSSVKEIADYLDFNAFVAFWARSR